jgi:hypothetical protein
VNAGCLGASSVRGDGYGANDKQEVHISQEEDKEDSSACITLSSLICCHMGSIETLRITQSNKSSMVDGNLYVNQGG